jgi:ribosomal protein S18 acetylase RimI-like enzyme
VTPGLVIREAGPTDAAVVAQLFSEFNALLGADGVPDAEAFAPANVTVSPEQMQRRLKEIAAVERVWLAEVDGEPSGLACLRLVPYIGQDAPYAELTQLYVRGRFQRLGVGAALIRTIEAAASEAGATCVHIITGNNNGSAQAFYRSVGYESASIEFTKYLEAGTDERQLSDG